MKTHFTKGMLKAFLLSTISLNCWAAANVPGTNCTSGVAPSCDRSGADALPLASPAGSAHGSLPPSSGASTESDGISDAGSETGGSESSREPASADALSLYTGSPGRLPIPTQVATSTAGANFVAALGGAPTIGEPPLQYLTAAGTGAIALAPGGMPLLPGLLTPGMTAFSIEGLHVMHTSPGVTVIRGIPGLDHLTATALAANPAAGALLAAYPETVRWARGLFIPAEPAAPTGEVPVPSVYAKRISIILDNVPALDLGVFARQVESIRLLIPKAFKNDEVGAALQGFMSVVSSVPTQEERNLLVAQLKWIHSLDPKALDHETGSHALIRLTKAMTPFPGAKRAALLKDLQPVLRESLDKVEVISLTFEMPEAHIVPVLNQVKRFVRSKLPPRKFGPIVQITARHFDPANPAYIAQAIEAAMHVTRKEKSSEDHASIIEGFAQIPVQKIERVKAKIRLLEKPHMSGDDIKVIVQALAQGNTDHIEKVAEYTATMVNDSMSAKDISVVISAFYTIVSRSGMSKTDIEAISHQSKPLLQAMERFGKIKHSETYGHVLENVAGLPSRMRRAIINEALRYLAHPTEYHTALPKRIEDAKAQWDAAQRKIDEVAPEAIRLEAVAKEKKAAAEAAVKEWQDHLPIIEDYVTHEKKLNDIRTTALENQLNEELAIQLLEEDMPKLSADSQKLQQENIASHKERVAKAQKTVREAIDELSMVAESKKIAMDVLEELKLDSGIKSTAAADAAHQASISFMKLKAAADKVEELEVARNSAAAIQLVDAIFTPERILGRKVISAGPARYDEDEYTPGFLEASSKPISIADWSRMQAAATAVPTIKPAPVATPRTPAEELAHKKADLENEMEWAAAAGSPWSEELKATRRKALEEAWRAAYPLPMRRSDY